MEGKFVSANIWGVPVSGSIISLDKVDSSLILSAASGLVTTLVKAGGVAIGLGIGLAGVYLILNSYEQPIPISSMANINASSRRFKGVCLNKTIEMDVHGQHLNVPVEFIKEIKRGSFLNVSDVRLVDDSIYIGAEFRNPKLEFVTLAGLQTVDLNDKNGLKIKGNTVRELTTLKNNLAFALENCADQVVKTIGKNLFEKYFYKGTTP